MARHRNALTPFFAAFIAFAAALAACRSGPDENATAPQTTTTKKAVRVVASPPHPRGVVEDCSTRSEADFPGAFEDPANLVVGPLALVGAAEPTSAGVVVSLGGQKFPALVKQGHVVTLHVEESVRAHAALGYGPLPQGDVDFRDGHEAVTFVACARDEPSGSSADGPVTFWSGFVLAGRPACVPLDVYVDAETEPRRVELELGRACDPKA